MAVWITQLGLSVALPPVGFILLAKWLQSSFGWGDWVFWVGAGLGLVMAIDGFIQSLKAMSRLSKGKKDPPPTVSFHDHD